MIFKRLLIVIAAALLIAAPATAAAKAPKGGVRIELSTDRPVTPEMFGQANTYASSRGVLVQWVNYTYAEVFPDYFLQPTVYEVRDASTYCGGQVYNALYCKKWNTIAYSKKYAKFLFNRIGDAGFAALIAHEYGHGAAAWFNYTGWGYFRNEITGEGFADCMAGGFMVQMYNWGHLDNLGFGDWNETVRTFNALADRVTATDGSGHGDAAWRSDKLSYGWTNGMNGCAQLGGQWAQG